MAIGVGDLGIVETDERLIGLWSPRNLSERQATNVLEGTGIRVFYLGRELTAEALRRVVGGVRIDRVNVEEEWVLSIFPVQPLEDLLVHAIGASRLQSELIEPLPQPRVRGEVGVGREGDRAIGGVGEQLGHREEPRRQSVFAVVDTVGGGSQAGEDRSHCGLGPGGLGHRLVEDVGLAAEFVDLRRDVAGIAVQAQVVGSHRVDHIDQDIGPIGLQLPGIRVGDIHEGLGARESSLDSCPAKKDRVWAPIPARSPQGESDGPLGSCR